MDSTEDPTQQKRSLSEPGDTNNTPQKRLKVEESTEAVEIANPNANENENGEGGSANGSGNEQADESIAEDHVEQKGEDGGSGAAGEQGSESKEAATRPVRGEDGFTSELYKIRVDNVPRHSTATDLRKFLLKNGVETVKIKRNPQWDHMFVTFKDDETKHKALEKINTLSFKGRKFEASDAPPLEDPLKKENNPRKEKARKVQEDDSRTPAEKLNDQVTPLWRKTYPEQLAKKAKGIKSVLEEAKRKLQVYVKDAKEPGDYSWLEDLTTFCPIEEITPSPVEKFYRNKCEFSIGRGEDGQIAVGFLLGLYKDGFTGVTGASECIHIPPLSLKIAQVFRDYVRQSALPFYDRATRSGFWKLLVVRTNQAEKSMIVIQANPAGVPEDVVKKEKEQLKAYFAEKREECRWESVLFQVDTKVSVGFQEASCELLLGERYIEETLLGKKFRISPTSFFQTNTKAAEVLYTLIGDCCTEGDNNTILLDLCCGTGTIGLTLASRVKKVIGVEMVKEAIEDAKINAQLNGIENVEYHCSKVESVIDNIIKQAGSNPIVAVVDPPRAGLLPSVMKTIRECANLKNLVYVSCDPQAALANFVDLARPPSKRNAGPPFKPVKALPVDMFPSTEHCELIIKFLRD